MARKHLAQRTAFNLLIDMVVTPDFLVALLAVGASYVKTMCMETIVEYPEKPETYKCATYSGQ
jgi:hypothetical protein